VVIGVLVVVTGVLLVDAVAGCAVTTGADGAAAATAAATDPAPAGAAGAAPSIIVYPFISVYPVGIGGGAKSISSDGAPRTSLFG
jgi:hypothetical protein